MPQPRNRGATDGIRTSGSSTTPRRVIATFDSYADAERVVDHLSDSGFAVERTAIVGRGLKYVEQVTGRLTRARAALSGAASGAFAGFLVGWLFGLFDWWNPVISSALLALWGLLFGAVVGAVMGMVAHALTGGRRDFASIGGMQAERFEVVVDEDVADEAERLVSQLPASTAT